MKGKTMALDCEENMCFIGFVFACFVFAGVFISDEGEPRREPRRVCQAPVSMQAIISASFEVYVCVCWACMCASIVVLGYVAWLF